MAFRFWEALKYVDNVVECANAVSQYLQDSDESKLADKVTKQILEAIQETVGDISAIDEEKVRQGVVTIVDGLEPIL